MWKVVVAIFIGGLVLAVVLMSEPVKAKVNLATDSAKKTAKKIQAAVTKSSSVQASKADLETQGIRIEGTAASAAIVENERADQMDAMADEMDKADAAKQASLLAEANKLLAQQDSGAATTAAPLTLDQQRTVMEAELKAYDLGKSSTAATTESFEQGVMPFVGYEHAAYL